jgi:outer membrane beta-barrel protein
MKTPALFTGLLVAALAAPAFGQATTPPGATAPQQPGNEQVVQPEIDRREVNVPRIPSNDFEVGAFAGTYSTQNFGSSAVGGLRLGYHVTEDIFVEGVAAQTHVSDDAFRRILPGGVFAQGKEKLTYYNLSAGFNVMPGESFFGKGRAKASAVYIIGGIGSTRFADQRRQTFNVGFGARLWLADWAAVQLDLRDQIFSLDLLGKRESTQNLEATAGLTFFF